MAKENIELLSTKKLVRRRNFVVFISGLSVGISLFSLGLLLYKYIYGETENVGNLIPGIALPLIVLPMYVGLKKINQELKKRQNEND